MIWQKKTIELGDFTDHLVGSKDSKIWTKNLGEHCVHISNHNLTGYYSSVTTEMAFTNGKYTKKDTFENGLSFMTEVYKINQMTTLIKLWCDPDLAIILFIKICF